MIYDSSRKILTLEIEIEKYPKNPPKKWKEFDGVMLVVDFFIRTDAVDNLKGKKSSIINFSISDISNNAEAFSTYLLNLNYS